MCQIGDIILVQKYKDRGQDLSRHSFVVISDENGEIQGLRMTLSLMFYLLSRAMHNANEN